MFNQIRTVSSSIKMIKLRVSTQVGPWICWPHARLVSSRDTRPSRRLGSGAGHDSASLMKIIKSLLVSKNPIEEASLWVIVVTQQHLSKTWQYVAITWGLNNRSCHSTVTCWRVGNPDGSMYCVEDQDKAARVQTMARSFVTATNFSFKFWSQIPSDTSHQWFADEISNSHG